MPHPTAPTLDAYLHESMEVIQFVHDNMHAIRAVADHLTPVEDLVEFQAEIEALYAKLGLLVEASEIIIRATVPGLNLLLAVDVAQQRGYLELKSAALREASYFATASDLAALQTSVASLSANVTFLLNLVPLLATKEELQEIIDRVDGIEGGLGDGSYLGNIQDLIDQINALLAALGGQITAINDTLTDHANGIQANANALVSLTATVVQNGQDIIAQATHLISLTTSVSNVQLGLAAQGTALESLTTRTSIVEGVVESHSEHLIQLDASVQDLDSQVSGNSNAISSLTTRVTATEDGITSVSNETTLLTARVVDAEENVSAQGAALAEMEVRVEANELGMSVIANDVVDLQASITSTGNQMPNSAFAYDVRNWTMYSRGTGWVTGQLSRNYEPSRLPPGVGVLSAHVTGVPSGDAGIRSTNIPVEESTHYILSAYLAAENCTFRLEYRILDGAGLEIGFGTIAEVTDVSPTDKLNTWQRKHGTVIVPADGALLQVQLWILDVHTATPKAWMLRPMLEEKVGNQSTPSPWTDGMGGLEEVLATAVQSLEVRVSSTEDGLESLAEAVTDLGSFIGSTTQWQINTHAGSGDGISIGAPLPATLRKVGGDAVYSFLRGLTLLRFDIDGELATAVRYDTFSSSTERENLAAALNALTQDMPFVLVSRDAHGIKHPDLTAAMEACGALAFKEVSGGRNYVLMGRGELGKGHGMEVFSIGEDKWLQHKLMLINDTPIGLGEAGGLGFTVAGQATAIDTLTTRVTTTEDTVEALSSAVIDLDARVVIAETGVEGIGSALTDLTTRVVATEDSIEVISSDVTDLSAQVTTMDGDVDALGTAVGVLTTRVSDAEDELEVVSAATTALTGRIDDAEEALTTTADALSALTIRVSDTEDVDEATALQLTALSSRIDDAEDDIDIAAGAISSLGTRVTATEDALEAVSEDLTLLTADLGDIGGENLLFNSSFEYDTDANGLSDGYLTYSTGSGTVVSRVTAQLPGSYFAQSIAASCTNAQSIDAHNHNDYLATALEGEEHILSVFARGTVGSVFQVIIQFLALDKATVLGTVTAPFNHVSGGYVRYKTPASVAPAGTRWARVVARTYGNSGVASATFQEIDNIQFQMGKLLTNYSYGGSIEQQANATALQTLTARVTSAEGVNTSQATFLTDLQAGSGQGTSNPNIIGNPTLDVDTAGWNSGGTGGVFARQPPDSNGGYGVVTATGSSNYHVVDYVVPVAGLITYFASVDLYWSGGTGNVLLQVYYLNASDVTVGGPYTSAFGDMLSVWKRVSAGGTTPATATKMVIRIAASGTSQSIYWRRAKAERSNNATPYNTDGYVGGSARALSTLSATVVSQGGSITTQAGQITTLTADVAGKASASAVSSLTARVVEVEQGGQGVNQVVNSQFLNGIGLVTRENGPGTAWGVPVIGGTAGTGYYPKGMSVIGSNDTGVRASSEYTNVNLLPHVAVHPGKRYIASVYMALYRAQAQCFIAWCDSDGVVISYSPGSSHDVGNSGTGFSTTLSLADMPRIHVAADAPSGARYAFVLIQITGNGNINPHYWIMRPMFEAAAAYQTVPSAYNTGGAESFAEWKIALDAGGNVAGLQLLANGATSAFKVRADLFEIVPPSGSGERLAYSSNNMRIYDVASTMRVRLGVW